MIARVAQRGHSFKGAGQYYLHDKESHTDERVAWVHTHNLPTDDPEKALRFMAFTAMNAEHLKREAGIRASGRKATAGPVYTFSLSWSPEEAPLPLQMKQAALDTLEGLGLIEHEAVMVGHQDTDHPHVHIIINLVNPGDGRTAVPSYDFLALSQWAESYEKENGKVYCPQRVINNERRREEVQPGRQNALIKHREQRHQQAELVQQLYQQSDSGRAFKAALEEQGLSLSKGDRRGFVLVDGQGKISSLSRQLKGQQAADIRQRLRDLENLPPAKELAAQRQQQIVPATPKEEPDMTTTVLKPRNEPQKKPAVEKKNKEVRGAGLGDPLKRNVQFLKELDRKRAAEEQVQRKRHRLEQEQESFYQRQATIEHIAELKRQLKANTNVQGRWSGRLQALEDQLKAERQNLADMNQRMDEQRQALEKEIRFNQKMKKADQEPEKPEELKPDPKPPEPDRDQGEPGQDYGPDL